MHDNNKTKLNLLRRRILNEKKNKQTNNVNALLTRSVYKENGKQHSQSTKKINQFSCIKTLFTIVADWTSQLKKKMSRYFSIFVLLNHHYDNNNNQEKRKHHTSRWNPFALSLSIARASPDFPFQQKIAHSNNECVCVYSICLSPPPQKKWTKRTVLSFDIFSNFIGKAPATALCYKYHFSAVYLSFEVLLNFRPYP